VQGSPVFETVPPSANMQRPWLQVFMAGHIMQAWPPVPQFVALCAVAVAGMQMPELQQPFAHVVALQLPWPPPVPVLPPLPHEGTTAARKPTATPSANALKFIM
jgi:hypothetical protein